MTPYETQMPPSFPPPADPESDSYRLSRSRVLPPGWLDDQLMLRYISAAEFARRSGINPRTLTAANRGKPLQPSTIWRLIAGLEDIPLRPVPNHARPEWPYDRANDSASV